MNETKNELELDEFSVTTKQFDASQTALARDLDEDRAHTLAEFAWMQKMARSIRAKGVKK